MKGTDLLDHYIALSGTVVGKAEKLKRFWFTYTLFRTLHSRKSTKAK